MGTLNYFNRALTAILFYDYNSDDQRPKTFFSTDLSKIKLFFKFFKLTCAFPLSTIAWTLLRILSFRYKVTIYVLKSFRPGWASTYLNMMEPLCRQLQHENNSKHIKILVEPGEAVSKILVKSYEQQFTWYLDDRRKFLRLIAYLIPKSGLEKRFINTSDKFLPSWLYLPSKNYANLTNQTPSDLANMGIESGNYVLFAHASRNYYEARLSLQQMSQIQHRFYDLSTYELALANLSKRNLKIVRIGVQVDELPVALKNLPIIDYTGRTRTEESELWLYENCRILLSATSGAFWFARRFDRPSIITNSYSWPLGFLSSLFTLMTIRRTDSGELLSFAETIQLKVAPNFLENQFMKDNHLELIPNSATTIANAVTDLLDLDNHQFKSTPEDLDLIKRYEAMLTSLNIPIVPKTNVPAISFLRE